MKYNKYFKMVISFTILLIASLICTNCGNDNSSVIDSETLIMYKLSNKKLTLYTKNVNTDKSNKITFRDKSINKNSVITEYDNCWLLNSPDDNQKDQLFFPYDNGKFVSLNEKGYSLIGASSSSLILVKYDDTDWNLMMYNIENEELSNLNFSSKIDDKSRVLRGSFNKTTDKFLSIYTNQNGTYLLEIINSQITSIKLSEEILNGYITYLDDKFLFIASDINNTKPIKLYLIETINLNESTLPKSYNLDITENINNSILASTPITNDELLLISNENGGNLLSLYKLNINNTSIKKLTDKNIQTQGVKQINNENYIISNEDFFKINNALQFELLK
ncbi:MAG: hypothetical protein IJH34_10690 [Romboutsia sp.]|uniref:hypothetical protein n=1 Tax=Clostridium sp. DSM 8431 TaxID=1761781 RepID=UPI0008ED083C|nr:hypothetical protein [Clostridium sp. DSM 8431]MBQ3422113.1 hypothetical protein [Romboutsia sp.]SFU80225.1 hypothetical protein SAMN04487886_11738 [Clostridium sp. DSM 8431]